MIWDQAPRTTGRLIIVERKRDQTRNKPETAEMDLNNDVEMQRARSLACCLSSSESDVDGEREAIEAKKKSLKEQIAQEQRLVRIYEAELSLMRHRHASRKRARSHEATTEPETNETERDWLETLDALQSNLTTLENGEIQLGRRWHDDQEMHRLNPLIGGVCFTSAMPRPSQRTTEPTFNRTYELKGRVSAKNATPVEFVVEVNIEFHKDDVLNTQHSNTAKVVGLDCSFVVDDINVSSKDELDKISNNASHSCNLPHLFRQLVRWAELDARRTKAFVRWQNDYGHDSLKRLSAHTFRIQLGVIQSSSENDEMSAVAGKTHEPSPRLSLLMSWRWNCSWFGSGEEELEVLDCTVRVDRFATQPSALRLWVKEIQDPKGLQDLLSCVGSCEQAIQIILQSLLEKPDR